MNSKDKNRIVKYQQKVFLCFGSFFEAVTKNSLLESDLRPKLVE